MQGPRLHGVRATLVFVKALRVFPVLPVDVQKQTRGELTRQFRQNVFLDVPQETAAVVENGFESISLLRRGGRGQDGVEMEQVMGQDGGAADDLKDAASGTLFRPIAGDGAEPCNHLVIEVKT